MRVLSFLPSAILFVSLSLAQMSCNGKSDEKTGGGASNSSIASIPLDSVQSGGCLNISLYAKALGNLNSTLPLFATSKKFSISGGNATRESFRLVTAFATFEFRPLNSAADDLDLLNYDQQSCKTINYESADGKLQEFKITTAEAGYVAAEAETGDRISYRWLSPQSVEVSTRYRVYDYPCTENFAFAEHTRVLDWSGVRSEYIEAENSTLTIDPAYVHLLASAVGSNEEELYAQISASDPNLPPRKVLVASKLSELSRAEVRPELLGCDGGR